MNKLIATMVMAGGLLFVINSAFAELQDNGKGWVCGTSDDWLTATFNLTDEFVVNNFNFTEKDSFLSNMKTFAVEYANVNKSENSYELGSQFVGFREDGSVTFAVSAQPPIGIASPGLTTITGDVYVSQVVLAETTKICGTFSYDN